MSDIELIDDFLTVSEFKLLSDKILNNEWFAWYLNHGVSDNNITESNKNHYCFGHNFYVSDAPASDYFTILDTIIEKLDVKSLLRCKANLYYKTKDIIEHGLHTDFNFPHKGALLNLTTNNGYTLFDGKKYKSIENQMIIFDTNKPHTSTTCTDAEFRANIIINYF
jgi:hypothetical protein